MKIRNCAISAHCQPYPYSCYGCPWEIMIEEETKEDLKNKIKDLENQLEGKQDS